MSMTFRQKIGLGFDQYAERIGNHSDRERHEFMANSLTEILGQFERRGEEERHHRGKNLHGKQDGMRSAYQHTQREIAKWKAAVERMHGDLERQIAARMALPRVEATAVSAVREMVIVQALLGMPPRDRNTAYINAWANSDFETIRAIDNAPKVVTLVDDNTRAVAAERQREQVLRDPELASTQHLLTAQERLLDTASRHVTEVLQTFGVQATAAEDVPA